MACWRPKNLNDGLMPLITLYAILGYTYFQYPSGKARKLPSIIYSTILTLIYWFFFALNIKISYESPWFGYEEKIFYIIVYFNFIIATFSQILSFRRSKKTSRLLKRISDVDETLFQLGETFDYTKCMYSGLKMIFFWILLISCQNFVDVLWFTNYNNFGEMILTVSLLHHCLHMNCIILLHFCLFISIIKLRFSKVNKLLEDQLKPYENQITVKVTFWKYLRNRVNEIPIHYTNKSIVKNEQLLKNIVLITKHVHLELTLISKELNEFYGIIILLEMAADFVLFTGLFFTLFDVIVNPLTDRKLIRTIIIVTWIAIYFIKFFLVNYMCEQIMAEAKRTSHLIHCIMELSEDSELLDELRQFSFQLLTNDVSFSPIGFFNLGYGFIRAFFGTVVTYLVILIQVDLDSKL